MKRALLLAGLCLSTALHAAIIPGSSTSSANVSASSGLGPMSAADSRTVTGRQGVVLGGGFGLSDRDGTNFIETSVTFSITASHAIQSSSTDYLRVTGGASNSVSYSEDDWNWDANNALEPTSQVISAIPGCSTAFDFSITNTSQPVSLTGSLTGNPTSARVFLHLLPPGGGTVLLFQAATIGPFTFNSTLAPGDYRVTTRIETNADTGPSGSSSFDLAVGTAPVTPDPFDLGEYTDGHFYTELTNSPRLTVDSPAIVSQVSQGNGTTLVSVTANLSNTSPCPWEVAHLTVPATFPGGPDVTIQSPNDDLWFPSIAANATATPELTANVIDVLVADADLAAFNASILSGERFNRTGRELWVFYYPVLAVGQNDVPPAGEPYATTPREEPFHNVNIARPEEITLFTDHAAEFPPGLLLLEDPLDPLPLSRESTGPGLLNAGVGGNYAKNDLGASMPFLVKSAGFSGSTNLTTISPRTHPVTGRRLTLLDLVKHGTIVDTVELPHPSGLDVTDGLRGSAVARNHPIHFNRVAITDDITLSGSLFFKPGKLGISFTMEDGLLTSFTTTGEFDAGYTLLLETKLPTNNSSDPPAAQETTLFSVPLLSIPLASGVTFTPTLSMDLGASVNAPEALTIPIEASMHVSFTAGMKNGQPFYDHHFEAEPPTLSPPALFEQLGASANAWIKPELHMLVGIGVASAGPTFGARLSGNFGLTPAQSPWWSLQGDLDFLAGIEFGIDIPDSSLDDHDKLDEILTFVDEEKVLSTTTIFAVNSNDFAAPSAARTVSLPDNPGIQPAEGKNTRWARATRFGASVVDDHTAFIFPVPGTTDLIAGGLSDLSRYGADGTLKFSFYPPFHSLTDAVPEDDEGFTTLGGSHTLARYDALGTQLWQTDFTPPSGTLVLVDLERRVNLAHQSEYFLAGWFRDTGISDALALLKYDDSGSLLWARLYHAVPVAAENTDSNATSISLTTTGDLLLTGFTSTDLAGTTDPNFNTPAKPLLMKISGDDGTVLWANALAATRGGQYECAIESPEGEVYAGGACAVNVLDDIPPMALSKFNASGTLIDSILIGSSAGEGAVAPAYDQGPVPFNGETPFDMIRSMVWKDGRLWIGGTIGAGAVALNLSGGQGGFTARLSPQLAIDRFVLHDIGGNVESIVKIADGGDGLLACGYSRSVLPWPKGSPAQEARLVMKLPDEGILRFHDLSNAAQPAQGIPDPVGGSHYIYPRTVASSDVTSFAADIGSGAASTYPITFTTSTLSLVLPPFPPEPLAPAVPYDLYQLDYVPPQVVVDLQSYLDYHQIDATDNSDNDVMDAETEFFYGSDPFSADFVTPFIQYITDTGGDFVVLSIPRSKLAAPLLPSVYDSDTLSQWDLRTDSTATTSTLDGYRDWLHLTLPVLNGQDHRFYRLSPP